jgi:Kef-type K+ transport system membrane component KefB
MDFFNSILRANTTSASGQAYQLLLPVALILLLTKGISVGFSKLKLPQVIGFLVAGLLVGLISFMPTDNAHVEFHLSVLIPILVMASTFLRSSVSS